MRLCRILLSIGALAMTAVPAAAQSKPLGSPAVMTARPSAAKAKSADARIGTLPAGTETTGRGQLPLGEKIALTPTLRTRLQALLAGSTLTYDQATTGWRNQGQLVAAMEAAQRKNLSFAAIHSKVVTDGMFLVDAVAELRGAQTLQ